MPRGIYHLNVDTDTVRDTVGRNRLVEATKDVTGSALATKLGSTQSFIWRVLKGTRLPGRQLAAMIEKEFPNIPATAWDQEPSEPGGTEPKADPAATPVPVHAPDGTIHVPITDGAGKLTGKPIEKAG